MAQGNPGFLRIQCGLRNRHPRAVAIWQGGRYLGYIPRWRCSRNYLQHQVKTDDGRTVADPPGKTVLLPGGTNRTIIRLRHRIGVGSFFAFLLKRLSGLLLATALFPLQTHAATIIKNDFHKTGWSGATASSLPRTLSTLELKQQTYSVECFTRCG